MTSVQEMRRGRGVGNGLRGTLLVALVLAALPGCSTPRAEQPEAARPAASAPKPAVRKTPVPATRSAEAVPARAGNRVRLTQAGCVEFEPQWSTLRVGQSMTWTSDLGTPVTIHVSAGAFDKAEYVLRAGGTVTTGPARAPGTYTIWSEPGACQGVPRGVRGSGPGFTVEGPSSD